MGASPRLSSKQRSSGGLDLDIKSAIETGDTGSLRALLAEDPSRANAPIEWGNNYEIRTHPLHYVSDMLFGGVLKDGDGTDLIEALLEAGAACNHQAPNGETALIGAASLAAEEVGLRLLDAGALPNLKGAFRETALHWAAYMGLRRLCLGLVEKGADVNVRDARYEASPLGWAIHGRYNTSPTHPADHYGVAELLVQAGATIDAQLLNDENVKADSRMLAALNRS